MQASEDAPNVPSPDEKHKLWGKEQQGLGAQMATSKSEWRNGSERTMDRLGVPRDLSSQITPQRAAGTYDKLAMFPPSAQPLQPQAPAPQHLTAQGSTLSIQQPGINSNAVAFPTEEKTGWGFGGGLSYGRERPKNGPIDAYAEIGLYSNKALQEQEEEAKQKDRKISPNQTGEEQEVNYYGR